uniref:Uncharacterized protein n=1 Tax=Rhizophora mucronata TaxID=61149 RepID=A0A2P2P4Q0_RHIMU
MLDSIALTITITITKITATKF